MHDPRAILRRRVVLHGSAAGCLVLAAAAWALWPMELVAHQEIVFRTPVLPGERDSQQRRVQLDEQAFSIRLWTQPPSTTVANKKPEKESRPKLELIGIVRDGDILRASLYEPSTDRLYLVRSGEEIGKVTVEQVHSDHVQLSLGSVTWELKIREEHS